MRAALSGKIVMKIRIGVLQASRRPSKTLVEISRAIVDEYNSSGFQASLARGDEIGLSTYDFLVICSQPAGLGGKLDNKISDLLGGNNLIGKRCLAVMVKSGLRPGKALARLMAELEGEGLVVTMAEIVSDKKGAADTARNAPVIRG